MIVFQFTHLVTGTIDYECQTKTGGYYYSQNIKEAKVYDKIGADIFCYSSTIYGLYYEITPIII